MTHQGTVVSENFHLNYTIEGVGLPMVVIGSALYYPRTFTGNIRQYLQLIFVDHRGFAHQANPQQDIAMVSMNTLLDDIELVRQALGLERFILAGHSGHAFLALEYTKRYPQYVSHLLLIGASPDFSPRTTQARFDFFELDASPDRKAALQRSLATLPDLNAAQPDRRFVNLCLSTGPLGWYDYDFDASFLWEGVITNMAIIDHVWGVLFRDIDIFVDIDKLTQPVLLALGRYDYLTGLPFLWEQAKSRFPNLSITIFERSAHTPQYEEATRFNQSLLDWLNLVPFVVKQESVL
ncbi:alpha/beta fold hydrolase [Spirosoma panaciterrae]|uniref:alpha/beta fold hydrolase n=1 Tax=Spirosoma panaciterrae TaxID=496058 RepID=UPI00037550B4|nr:alpha/beta hydrolase [Spirosoma panaciterrae]